MSAQQKKVKLYLDKNYFDNVYEWTNHSLVVMNQFIYKQSQSYFNKRTKTVVGAVMFISYFMVRRTRILGSLLGGSQLVGVFLHRTSGSLLFIFILRYNVICLLY